MQSASIAISAVVNGASNLAGPVSPGEIVVITGSGLGPGQLIPATPGANGLYSTQLSGTTVQFNGTPAPLIYTSAAQVAAQVPDSVSVRGGAESRSRTRGARRPHSRFKLLRIAPGVFTLDSTGKGQAVAMNQDGSINTAATPAAAGDVISLYVTGVTSGQGGVFVTIGGQDAMV